MATTNKTYFQYQGTIKSREVSEAIGLPCGMGPFMGFARVKDEKMYATLESSDTSSRYSIFRDKFNTPGISHKVGSISPNFGLITRSGHIFVSSNSEIPITIVNSRTNLDELMVFALYQEVEQPIETIPILLGYYNNSNSSFYDNFYAPLIKNSGEFNIGNSLINEANQINFTSLYTQVKTALGNDTLLNNITLIGIYGKGTNPNNGEVEDFSIVPYQGQWPYQMPWVPSTYSNIQSAINKISVFLGQSDHTTLTDTIRSLLPSEEAKDTTLVGVPIGTILMWYGERIPDGWALCDGTGGTPDLMGRFPLGSGGDFQFGSSGGSTQYTLGINNIPAHSHKMGYTNKKWGDDADDRPFPVGPGGDTQYETTSVGSDRPSPIDIMPPYTVVKFIMRVR